MKLWSGFPVAAHNLANPTCLDELFLYRLTRLLAVAGAPVARICEGRHGITRREWRLIAALAESGPLLSSELAEKIGLEAARTSKAISLIVQKRLATRSPRPNDRRLVTIALTDSGRELYASLFPETVRINHELLESLSEDELETLDSLLIRLDERARERLHHADLPRTSRRYGTTARRSGGAS
jgi:DNA-binding MarR family transcriptional regulator